MTDDPAAVEMYSPFDSLVGLVSLSLRWSRHDIPISDVKAAVGLLFEDENVGLLYEALGVYKDTLRVLHEDLDAARKQLREARKALK